MERKPRLVKIERIELLQYVYPCLRLRVACGSGTYMRALARDVGAALGVGGYASALHRLAVGELTIEKAIALDQLTAQNLTQLTFPSDLLT